MQCLAKTSRVLTAATVIVLLTGAIDEARAQCLANEHEQLIASDPGEGDRFGEAVAISGDLAVVGASCDDTLGHYSGSAYVLRFDGVGWIEEQKLTASDGAAEDRFGVSVGASEDYIVIGAHMDDDAGQDSGSAYLYRFDPNSLSWVEQQKLLPDDGEPGERFGLAAALFGDTIVVGAYHDNDNGAESGSAYIFIRDDAGTPGDPSDDIWVQHDKLLAPDGAAEDQFGFAVAISDDTAIIGARYDDDLGLSTGSAYVYRRDDGGTPGDPLDDAWYLEEKLVPADGDDWSCFGNAVAIFGNTALLGAYVDDDIHIDGGSAYVFQRSDNGTPADPYDDFWVEQEKLVPSDSETSARFGQSVGIFGDIAVIGAFQKDDAGNDSGAAYVYRRGVAGWQHEAKLQPTDLAAEDRFGVSAAIFGTTALVGAHRNDAGGVDAGAVYVFTAMSDCNENDALDLCDIANGTSADCNFNEIPDECDVMTTEFQMGAGSYVIVPGSTSKLAITHADLDADSDEDLVVADTGYDTIWVLLNRGDGTFADEIGYGVETEPRDIAAADLNGDELPDLAVAVRDSAKVSVLLNLGDGTFGPPADYPVGQLPLSVAAGDFDLDGDRDLVAANADSDTVSVLMNNGNGTFAAAVSYAAGNGPHSVTVARLDGDDYPDLAVANCYTPHDVSILINQGNGTFAPPVSYASSSFWRYYIESGDLDNDGDIDLAVANGGGGETVTVLLNDGAGTFPTVSNYTLATEANPHSLSLADFDGDAYLDIVTANSDHDTVTVLRSDGDGTFSRFESYGVNHEPFGVTAVDLTGDARPDLAMANNGTNVVSFLFNLSASTSEDCNQNGIPDECDLVDGTSEDCNGDGIPDECQSEIGPTITDHPDDRIRFPGGSATFSVTAEGVGPLSYQWRHDGADIPGANDSSYTIDPILPEDAGEYDVVVSDDCGPTTSEPATLTVLIGPVITEHPGSQTICEYEPVTFSVQAAGSGPLTYQWRKDEVNIDDANESSYTIDAATAEDAGVYDVMVGDLYGSVTSDPATLTVNLPPTITQHPESQTVCEGGAVTFSVGATGQGDLSYQWFRNGYLIIGAVNASFTIDPVSLADAGQYEVEVTDQGCSVTSEPATLSVNTGPTIIEHPQSQTVAEGASVTFTVIAEGTPLLSYQWRKDGLEILDATDSEYTIDSVTTDDQGDYDVIVTDACGDAISDAATLTIGLECMGDIDGDGDVDLADLAALLAAYGCCVGDDCYNPAADLNGDGCVNLSDLALLLSVYGTICWEP